MRVITPAVIAAAAFLAFGLAAACGSDDESGDETPAATENSAPLVTPEPFAPSEAGEFLMEGASSESTKNDDHSYTITVDLPTGNTSETMFTLDPDRVELGSSDSSGLPGSLIYGFQLSHEITEQGLEWSYSYTASADSFPSEALALELNEESGSWLASAFDRLSQTRSASAAEPDGVQIIARGVLKEFGNEGLSQLEEHMGGRAGSPLSKGLDSILNVSEALDRSSQYQQMKQKLVDLRNCAENPTNEQTKRLYEERPEEKQKILDEIDDVTGETLMDTAVRFISALNSQAAGLTGVSWLGFITGPLSSRADAEIGYLSQQRIADLEKLVTPCEGHPAFVGAYRSPYGDHRPLPVGGIACTDDPYGKWAFISFANPSGSVSRDNLGTLINDSENRIGVKLGTVGEKTDLIYESPFDGLYEIIIGPVQHMNLTVTNPYRSDALIDEQQFELFKVNVKPDICSTDD